MYRPKVIVVGGGAAGFFGAITCAEKCPDAEVIILERGPRFLSKVKISGGGRCNVTHGRFDTKILAGGFPRGGKALIGPFHRFQAKDTVDWFESRGVKLKVEPDGRMFPTTDNSETIIECLMGAAEKAGIGLELNRHVEKVSKVEDHFEIELGEEQPMRADRLLLATGGCRTPALGQLAVSLGHRLTAPVPSLFTFHVEDDWVRELSGLSVDPVEVTVDAMKLKQRGALLMTHWGLSGPAILRLSAWGAREMNEAGYRFTLRVNWMPDMDEGRLDREIARRKNDHAAKAVVNAPIPPLPARLWKNLAAAAGVGTGQRWAELSKGMAHRLKLQLHRSEFQVTGKSLNKEEFVTCGGVALNEVDFKTMESKLCSELYFAGELLDIDGVTGGFNFQAAWTTGWIAGTSMAASLPSLRNDQGSPEIGPCRP